MLDKKNTKGTAKQSTTEIQAEQVVKEFHAILTRHRKLTRRPDIPNWTKTFQFFLEEGYRTYEELLSILEMYDKHLDDAFMPKAYSADSFLDKLIRIEDGIQRIQQILQRDKQREKIKKEKEDDQSYIY